jgi:hypothetical protein
LIVGAGPIAEADDRVMGGRVGAVTVGKSGLGLACLTSTGADGSGFSAGRLAPTWSPGAGSIVAYQNDGLGPEALKAS